MHAETAARDSRFFIGDEVPGWIAALPETLGGSAHRGLYLSFVTWTRRSARRVDRGATRETAPGGHVLGDRTGSVLTRSGHMGLATHREERPAAGDETAG